MQRSRDQRAKQWNSGNVPLALGIPNYLKERLRDET